MRSCACQERDELFKRAKAKGIVNPLIILIILEFPENLITSHSRVSYTFGSTKKRIPMVLLSRRMRCTVCLRRRLSRRAGIRQPLFRPLLYFDLEALPSLTSWAYRKNKAIFPPCHLFPPAHVPGPAALLLVGVRLETRWGARRSEHARPPNGTTGSRAAATTTGREQAVRAVSRGYRRTTAEGTAASGRGPCQRGRRGTVDQNFLFR